jgi:hypothetical protein
VQLGGTREGLALAAEMMRQENLVDLDQEVDDNVFELREHCGSWRRYRMHLGLSQDAPANFRLQIERGPAKGTPTDKQSASRPRSPNAGWGCKPRGDARLD